MVLTTLMAYKDLYNNVRRHEKDFRESEGEMQIANAKSLLIVLDSYLQHVPESARQEVGLDVAQLVGECRDFLEKQCSPEVIGRRCYDILESLESRARRTI